MFIDFKVSDTLCRKEYILYIPPESQEENGYVCFSYYGVPLGYYRDKSDGTWMYWFGFKDFDWFLSQGDCVSIFIESMLEGVCLGGFRAWKYRDGNINVAISCKFKVDLRKGMFSFRDNLLDDKFTVMQPCHMVSKDKLAKYYMMAAVADVR